MVYFCFSNHDELLTSGAKIEKLIVSHPALSEPTDIQILYIAYEGWIYSGRLVLVRLTELVPISRLKCQGGVECGEDDIV